MTYRNLLFSIFAATALSCAQSETSEPPARVAAAPATQGDIARLEQENAQLRAQVEHLTKNDPTKNPTMREAVAEVEIRQNKFQ